MNVEWSPEMRGMRSKHQSFSVVAASPYQALSRLMTYDGMLPQKPFCAASAARYSRRCISLCALGIGM